MKKPIYCFMRFCAVGFLLVRAAIADENAATAAKTKSEKPQAETAYVATTRAMVYSGPSEDYYPTQVLPQGTALEVYHQTDTGWLGIRPPGGSFSWVPASDAYLLPGGKSIEITSKNSVSWIGSSLGTAKQYRWQVRLNAGEQLTKLGEESIKDKDGKEHLWYKITPPNGEFRWIQSGAISRQPPANLAKQNVANNAAVVPASTTSSQRNNKSKVKPANHLAAQEGGFVYDGQVIERELVEGELVEGQVVEGDVIDGGAMAGEIIEGEIIDGEIIYEDSFDGGEYIVSEEVVPQYDANWNDWQLFEFTDEGLRLPFLERAAAWRATQPDPLSHDPFSLEMVPKKKRQMRPGLPPPAEPVSRRHTPWRDPRELSQQRMMGYPQASAQRGSGTTLSALRGTLNSSQPDMLGNGVMGGSILGSGGAMGLGGATNGPGSVPPSVNQPTDGNSSYYGAPSTAEPRLAPPIDWSARNQSNIPSLSQPSLSGSQSSMGSVDMPNLPQDPFAAAAGNNAAGGSWTNRNWFGLGQGSGSRHGEQPGFGLGVQPALTATGNALHQLQQRLSEMVTRPMQHWNFAELKERVRYYINNGSTPTERGQARLLLERIDEFERHAMRSGYNLSSAGGGAAPMASPTVITASYTTPAATANSGTIASSNFDATGWLVPVHAAGPNHPTHALTSDSGQIVAYVTSLPGMSLESFVNQAVGIHGLRGFLPEFQAAHIEAQNITRLR